MPILVTCKCGKKFRADEKHAGKQKLCPKCGQSLDISGPHVSAYDVFVSYSNKDKSTCDALCAMFESKGLRCWIAPRDILPGMNWGEAIIGGIEQSRVMVLVFSAHSNDSPQVKREVERAVSKGIPVVPLRIEDVKLSRAMEYFISSQHWLDALTPPLEKHLEELARKVMRLLSDDGSSAAGPIRSGPESIPKAIPVSAWTAPASDPYSLERPSSGPVWPASPTVNDPSPLGPNDGLSRPSPGITWTRIPLVWRWVAVGGAAALLFLLIFNFLRPSGVGTIKIDIPGSYANLTVKIDGETINASQLSSPLRLKVGEHRLEVAGNDIEPENQSFVVAKGENQAVKINLVSKPPVPRSTPAVAKSHPEDSVPTKSETAPLPANHDAGKTAIELVSPTTLPSVEPSTVVASEPAWTDLINGQNLTGWTPVASNGAWSVKDGILSTTPGDGWLATDRDYSDFELELEYKLPPNGNSGVFLRAPLSGNPGGAGLLEVQAIDDQSPQFRDVSERNKTGAVLGLFEASPPADAPSNKWNVLSIRAVGPRITVVVNGRKVSEGSLADQPRAALKPDMRLPTGRIGLQRRTTTGAEFRNIRIRDLSAGNAAVPASEPAWTDLFNGRDLSGWTIHKNDGEQPATPWAADGDRKVIVARDGGHSWLETEQTYRDFALNLEWRFPPGTTVGANGSGIVVRVDGMNSINFDPKGIEIDLRRTSNDQKTVGLGGFVTYDTPLQQSSGVAPASGNGHFGTTAKPAEIVESQWNSCEITCLADRITLRMNGTQVNEAWGAPLRAGTICLRNQNSGVEFRNIRIRELSVDESAIDVDRRAAEWVQSVKGVVEVQILGQASVRRIESEQPLPSKEFRVVTVNLYLNRNADDAGMTNLKGLTAIRNLWIHAAKQISLSGLLNAGLAEMQTLEDLGPIASGVDGRILEQVAKLGNLRSLTLDGLNVSDSALQQLQSLKKLEFLSLSFTSVTDAGLEPLHNMTNLKTVNLVSAKNVTATGREKLQSALPNCKVK